MESEIVRTPEAKKNTANRQRWIYQTIRIACSLVFLISSDSSGQNRNSPTLSRATVLAILKESNQGPRYSDDVNLFLQIVVEYSDALAGTFKATEDGIKNGQPLKLPAPEEIPANFADLRAALMQAHFYAALEKANIVLKYKSAESKAVTDQFGQGTGTNRITIDYVDLADPRQLPARGRAARMTPLQYDSGTIAGMRQEKDSAEAEVEYQLAPTPIQRQIEEIAHTLLREHQQDIMMCTVYHFTPAKVPPQSYWIIRPLCQVVDLPRKPLKRVWRFEKWDTGWRLARNQY
jgi:hypothetical protein